MADTTSLDAVTVQAVGKGGTGLDSYTAGDLLYASGTATLSKLPMGAAGQKLATNSGATAPEWVDETGDISAVSITAGTGLTGTVATTTGDHTQTLAVDSTFVATTSANGLLSSADKAKLDAIEASATADQTDAEIRAAVEAATDSNVFTDADHTKLNAIEASATADQTDAEIRAAVEAATDSNVFTDADHTKLNAVEAGATAEVAATTTTAGIVELATNAETTTGTDTARAVTPAGVQAAVDSILDGAPAALDTLNELAAAIDDDASYASTITTALAAKAPLASPTFTGTVAIPNISDLESAVAANTAKVSNVSTDLSASADGTSLTVSSSDGTNASIPAVTTSAWGAMTDEDKTKLDGVATGATANDTDANLKARANHTGTQAASTISDFDTEVANNSAVTANTAKVTNVTTDLSASADGTSLTVSSSDGTNASIPAATTSAWGAMTDEDKTKLDGVATGATANDTDANLKARANHTGTQAASTISDFDTEVANNTAVTANTAKVTNATHTGDVAGSTSLTIADNAVSLAKMAGLARGSIIIGDSSGDPAALAIGNDTYVLTSDGTDISWAAGGGGGGGSGHAIKDEGGSALSTRTNLNFIGELVAAIDNSSADSSDITIDAKTAWLYG
tara:strand:- start:1936 stop:3828 length:1893 start_codon:yes stop_codon:yes gene_type:complete